MYALQHHIFIWNTVNQLIYYKTQDSDLLVLGHAARKSGVSWILVSYS